MTDFVVSAKLIADASGLVSGAGQGEQAMDRVGEAAERAGAKGRGFAASTAAQSAQLQTNASAINQVIRATNPAISNQNLLDAALHRVRLAYIQGKVGAEAYARAEAIAARGARELADAQRGVSATSGQARNGMQQLSYQIGDVAQGLALGVNPAVIFAQQFGQIIQAITLTRDTAGGFLGFLAGPWGAALTGAITVLGLLTAGYFSNEEASTQSLTAADALGQAQSVLGGMFDLATGKIERNTVALRLNALMAAANMRAQAQQQRIEAGRTLRDATDLTWRATLARPGRLSVIPGTMIPQINDTQMDPQAAARLGVLENLQRGNLTPEQAVNLLTRLPSDRLSRSGLEIGQAIADIHNAPEAERIADEIRRSVMSGTLAESLRNPRPAGRGRQPRRPADQSEFGEDAARRITDITQRFTDTPAQVELVRKAMADLDDIISDIERRRPPNFEELLQQARDARPIIEEGINRPFDAFIQSQEESLRIQRLQAQGRDDEAEALQAILRLEQQQGPLNEAKRQQILENVRAIRDEQREMEILRQRQQLYLNALSETRKALTGTIQGVLGGDLRSLTDLPGQLLESFNRLTAENLVEQLFGSAFRELEDEITGRNQVRQANERLANSGDVAARAVARLGDAAQTAATGVASTAQADAVEQNIVVTGENALRTNPRQFFQRMVEGLLQGLVGEEMARTMSIGVARGLEGAAFGGQVNGILRMAGIQLPNGVAQAGGALLNQFPGVLSALGTSIPQLTAAMPMIGAAVAGTQAFSSLLGNDQIKHGKILGLFSPILTALFGSAKRGAATITSVDGAPTTRGNSSSRISAATGLATGVQGVLQQIADALGGSLGSFAGSIGIRKEKFVVDPTGQGRTKGSGVLSFDTEAQAVAALLADLLRDGAVKGLTAAVQRALLSSTDIDKALREAMKVDEVETLLNGLGGELAKQFRAFEQQAAERVRIATQYGFDVLEIEKINAAERLKLEKDILESRIGSLRELLDDLSFGDLFEGSLADQRNRLISELNKATADAEAGITGAADRQAQLSRDLVALSRETFGTAGAEFASDLERARTGAERVIELENERIRTAQALTQETNNQLNEANDQLSVQTNLLRDIYAGIGSLSSTLQQGGGASNTALMLTARLTEFV